ncbi:MAG: response regulator [Actinobacteria bacterium]|nr:MAG: response regulator [Actinomycetota bacterium]
MTIRCPIVDDNQSFLEAARTRLEREGLSVTGVATTGSEASVGPRRHASAM